MAKIRIGFWLGLVGSLAGISLLAGSWYYYHQTRPVAYLNKALSPGSVISYSKDVVLKQTQLPDLPANYIDPNELKYQTWRAVHTIEPTDPLTLSKLTNMPVFTMDKNQVIISHSFENTGLLSFIQPGDRLSIMEGTNSLQNILVLGKADKSGNVTDLLPSLKNSSNGEGLISSALSNPNTTADPPDALLLLMTVQQAQTLDQMKTPLIAMYGSPQMIQKGGTANGQALQSSQPSQSR